MDALAEMDIIKIKTLLQDIFSRYTSASGCLSQQIIFQLLQLGIRFQKEKGLELLKDTDAEFRNMNFSAMSQDAVFRLLSDYFVKSWSTIRNMASAIIPFIYRMRSFIFIKIIRKIYP